MLYPGLVSITFRQLAPREIVDLVASCGLAGIEWGGDVHAPHGDLKRAREVRALTEEAGLRVAAYGSYYRLRRTEPAPFEAVLETAVELGAPLVRVWAGERGSAEADAHYRAWIVEATRRAADLAAAAGVTVAYEYHRDTLTDTAESAAALLRAVDHPNVRSLWQPPSGVPVEVCLAALDAVTPWLANVHVFHWGAGGWGERCPLADGQAAWSAYLRRIDAAAGDRWALLEFVQDDAPASFVRDAATLKRWLAAL